MVPLLSSTIAIIELLVNWLLCFEKFKILLFPEIKYNPPPSDPTHNSPFCERSIEVTQTPPFAESLLAYKLTGRNP